MAVIYWWSIHLASNMFHGCNESKIKDPKDFLVYAWVFLNKAYDDCFWGHSGGERVPFSLSPPVLLCFYSLVLFHSSSSSSWQPFKPLNSLSAAKQQEGLNWGLSRPLVVRVGKGLWVRKCHVSHQVYIAFCLSICPSPTHFIHWSVRSFNKWSEHVLYVIYSTRCWKSNGGRKQNKIEQNDLTSWNSQYSIRRQALMKELQGIVNCDYTKRVWKGSTRGCEAT